MNILFITEVNAFPVRGGESLRSFGLLQCLKKAGYSVTVISPLSPDQPGLTQQFPGFRFIGHDFQPEKKSRLSEFAGYFRKDGSLLEIINNTLKDKEIRLAFIDYFFLGQYISFYKERRIPVIYGTHNAQSKLRIQQPAGGLMPKIVRFFSYLAQSWHERLYFKQADRLVCVSGVDRDFYRRFIAEEKIVLLPNFVDGSAYMPADSKQPYIIMTGNFESFQNYYGLKWFLENVWNQELAAITELYLLGRGSAGAFEGITSGKPLSRVRIINREAEILKYLAGAKVSVVPLWHGSGTRLKCIEAMAIKTQLVSTSIGAEGIDHGGSILIGDTPEQFREQVIRVLKGEADHTEQALQVFNKKYSAAVIGEQLDRVISSLLE